jgi:hypothetical protein
MPDFLSRLAARNALLPQAVQARQRSAYEPPRAQPDPDAAQQSDDQKEDTREAQRLPRAVPWRGSLEVLPEAGLQQSARVQVQHNAPRKTAPPPQSVSEIESVPPASTPRADHPEPAHAEHASRGNSSAEREPPSAFAPPRPAQVPSPVVETPPRAEARPWQDNVPAIAERRALEPAVVRPRTVVSSARERPVTGESQLKQKAVVADVQGAAPPAIRVSIGRIEVRAVLEPERPVQKRAAQLPLALEDYQRERRTGKR